MGRVGGACRALVWVCGRGVVVSGAATTTGSFVEGATVGVTTVWPVGLLDGLTAPAVAMYPTIAADDAKVASPANRLARCAGWLRRAGTGWRGGTAWRGGTGWRCGAPLPIIGS